MKTEPGILPRAQEVRMKAAVYRRFGGPEVVAIAEVRKPVPGRDDVLIRVHASTVSAADHRARSRSVPAGLGILVSPALGAFRPRKRVLGMDVAGVVEAVGANVAGFAAGDEVVAMLGGSFGGHAEFVCIPQRGAITAKPRNLTFEEAVTVVFGGITAQAFLNRVAVRPGTKVLVNGASGAVGTAAVQLASQLGASVTAVCSGGNEKLVMALGADRVIDYSATDFTAESLSYDVIVECVGNAPFERVATSLSPGGALLLVISDLRGMVLAPLRTRRSGKLVTAGGVTYAADALASVVRLAESGRFQAVIDRTYDLAEIAEAHRYVDTGHKRGNVVLRVARP